MKDDKPLVDAHYLLERFPGKGGWTYAAIPEILQNKNNPFGWVRIRGFIDDYELKQYKLMPMGNGRLFLPVKAAIRKKIKKEAGDTVRIILYRDETPVETPQEIMDCFEHEPVDSYSFYQSLSDGERQAYLGWIYDAKTENTKAERILKMMDRLSRKIKFYDKEK